MAFITAMSEESSRPVALLWGSWRRYFGRRDDPREGAAAEQNPKHANTLLGEPCSLILERASRSSANVRDFESAASDDFHLSRSESTKGIGGKLDAAELRSPPADGRRPTAIERCRLPRHEAHGNTASPHRHPRSRELWATHDPGEINVTRGISDGIDPRALARTISRTATSSSLLRWRLARGAATKTAQDMAWTPVAHIQAASALEEAAVGREVEPKK